MGSAPVGTPAAGVAAAAPFMRAAIPIATIGGSYRLVPDLALDASDADAPLALAPLLLPRRGRGIRQSELTSLP